MSFRSKVIFVLAQGCIMLLALQATRLLDKKLPKATRFFRTLLCLSHYQKKKRIPFLTLVNRGNLDIVIILILLFFPVHSFSFTFFNIVSDNLSYFFFSILNSLYWSTHFSWICFSSFSSFLSLFLFLFHLYPYP